MGNDLILHKAGGVSAEIQSSTGDSFIRFTDGGSHKFSIGFDNGDSTFANMMVIQVIIKPLLLKVMERLVSEQQVQREIRSNW